MPSSSGCSETQDRGQPERKTDDDSNGGQVNEIGHDQRLYRVHEPSRRPLRDHIRIATLKAEVALLERDRTTLQEEVAILETDLETLEEEVAILKETVACKDHQLQQVIDQYERIIAEKHRAYQNRVGEFETSSFTINPPSVSTIWEFVANIVDRLKRERTTKK